MSSPNRAAVEAAFARIMHGLAGETVEVGWHVLAQLLAGYAATTADTRQEAATYIAGIASDGVQAMQANFDFYRETAEHVGPRQ